MKTAIIIPARWNSTRFPGKPLASIMGQPLIFWTYNVARIVGVPVFIATDDYRIENAAKRIGAPTILTTEARNGTERCAIAHRRMGFKFDLIINWQGDAPLVDPIWVRQLIDRMRIHPTQPHMMTLAIEQQWHEGIVEAQYRKDGSCVDFCRKVWPKTVTQMHLGIYAIRAPSLAWYETAHPDAREQEEGLEQLRWPRKAVHILPVDAQGCAIRECNHPDDIAAIEMGLRKIYAPD